MRINREFPDFGKLDVTIDCRFIDDSWHNDICPSFKFNFENGNYLKIWVDYANVEKRESDQERFMLSHCDDDGECIDILMLSDNFEDITLELNRFLSFNPKGKK